MSSPSVMTVLGPVSSDQLGVTLMHEHLLIDLYRVSSDYSGLLSEVSLAEKEAAAFAAVGGATLVDVTTTDLGRSPEDLRKIAEATGLNIVMGCGLYRDPWYPPEVAVTSTAALAAGLIDEIEHGVSGTGIRPGVIGEIGCDCEYISPSEERVFRAAARAHLATGLTITTHALLSPVGLDQLALLQEEGVDPRRVIVGHCDSYPVSDFHEAVARQGAWVEFDLIRREVEWEIEKRVRLVTEMIARGYIDQLLLSQDVCRKYHLLAYGGGGYAYLLSDFAGRLVSAGVSSEQLDLIMRDNPRRALTGA